MHLKKDKLDFGKICKAYDWVSHKEDGQSIYEEVSPY